MKDLKRTSILLGHPPSYIDYRQNGQFSSSTIVNYFGKWDAAILETFGSTYRKQKKQPKLNECKNPSCDQYTKSPHFCSKSCAATVNGSKYPKRHKTIHLCPMCSKEISAKAQKCNRCVMVTSVAEYGEKRLGEFSSTYARHRYQNIRRHAHRIAKIHDLSKKCAICDYDFHVDLCHKQAIGSFDQDTKIKIINDIDNLVYLCKNHHWELDHGHITL